MNYMIKTANNERIEIGLFQAGNYYGIVRVYASSDDLLVSRHDSFDEADSHYEMLRREYSLPESKMIQHNETEFYNNYD